jgi:hypothetical protein
VREITTNDPEAMRWRLESMKINYIWIVCALLVVAWILFLGAVGSGAYWIHILLLAAAVLAVGYTLNRPMS